MTDNIPERLKKTLQTQIEKYGGVEGYRAEMRRRRSLVKTTGFAIGGREKAQAAQLKSAAKRVKNNEEKSAKSQDTAKEDE